jgi:hypothetical protein
MSAEDFRIRPIGAQPTDDIGVERGVVSAIFDDRQSAQAAITELRQIGIPADDISLISRDEDTADAAAAAPMAGVAGEQIGAEGLTYRTSPELPNDEDLSTTQAQMADSDTPVILEYDVPPDEPLGGSRQLGLKTDGDMVRRNEASADADVDIYTDFPDKPGGNPESPAAADASEAATEQMAAELGEERVGSAVIGAGLGSVAGLLVGIAALAVPGVGPILAAGPLATALGGMLAGGAVGGIIGALATVGVPEEYARQYAASIQEGSTLVTVRTDPLGRDAVERVLVAHGGRDVH